MLAPSQSVAAARPAGPLVWLAPRCAENRLAAASGLFSDGERARCDELRRKCDRERFLTGRILARQVLSRASGDRWPPAAWSFRADMNGKPHVAAPDGSLRISIAHSADMVAVAASAFDEIGVDIEYLDGGVRIEPSVLSERERCVLAGCRDAGAEFVKLWTMKEAYAKRTGQGVGMDFAALDLDWVPDCSEQRIHLGDCIVDCRVLGTSAGFYVVALASGGEQPGTWRIRDIGLDRD